MKINTLIAILFLTFGLTTQMSAQKFGFINSQELLQSLPEVKEANSEIEIFQNQIKKKGEAMLMKFQQKYQGLQQKQQKGEISPLQLETEATKLREEEKKIAEFDQNSQKQIIEKSETLLNPIMTRVQTAIDEVAKENGYSYIFDYSMGIILYAEKSTDVSAQVKAKLGL